MQTEGTTIQDLFVNFKIDLDSITAQKVFARLNDELSIGELHYSRKNQMLTYKTLINIPSTIPALNELKWPVACVIDQWTAPRCGIYEQDAIKSVDKLIQTSASPEINLRVENESSARDIGDSLNEAFKQIR